MKIFFLALFSTISLNIVFGQSIESAKPLLLSNGDTCLSIASAAKFNHKYLFMSQNKRFVYHGDSLQALQTLDFREAFFKTFDTSAIKLENSVYYGIKSWEDLFFSSLSFVRLGSENIGLRGIFVISGFREGNMIPFSRNFILIFSEDMTVKGIKYIDFPGFKPQPIIRNVFSSQITRESPEVYADVDYEETTALPPFIRLITADTSKTGFPNGFKLPYNAIKDGFLGRRFNLSMMINNQPRHLYINGFEVVDMEKKEIIFVSPKSTTILSPVMMVQGRPCVEIATVDLVKMKNDNFRYVSILDGSTVKEDVLFRNLPAYYVENLTGFTFEGDAPYLGIKIIDGKSWLINFFP